MPPGSRPIGVSVPTSAAATARTVPSPPSGQTIVTPCSTAWRACPVPGSSTVVSIHSGCAQPAARQRLGDLRADRLQVVELGGVDDDRRLALRFGGRRSGALGAEVVARRAAPAEAARGARPPRRRPWRATGPRPATPAGGRGRSRRGRPSRRSQSARPGRYPTANGAPDAKRGGRIAATSAGLTGARPPAERHHGRMTDDVAARPAGTDSPSAIPHETKDWTWVLQRPCPDCGFDTTDHPGATVPAVLHAAIERWSNLLAAPGHRGPSRPGRVVAAGVHLPRPRRLRHDHRAGAADAGRGRPRAARVGPGRGGGAGPLRRAGPGPRRRRAGRRRRRGRVRSSPVSDPTSGAAPGHRSDGTAFTVETLAQYLVHEVEHHLHDVGA